MKMHKNNKENIATVYSCKINNRSDASYHQELLTIWQNGVAGLR